MSITAITFAYFSASSKVDGVAFSFSKLDVNIMYDSVTSTNSASKNIGSVTTGSPLFSNVKVKLGEESQSGYIRVKLNYSGTDNDSQKTAIALNSILPLESTSTGTDYAWKANNGYFYLVDKNDNTQLKSVSKGEYTIFSSLTMPDITQFGGGLNTNDVKLEIKAEAVQSTNLKTSNGDSVTSIAQLESVISDSNIFNTYTNAGYIVNYDTCGGASVASNIVLNGETDTIQLPQVGDVSVDWYNNATFTGNKVGASNESYSVTQNATLYAKYPNTTSNSVYVFFNVNGGDESKTPQNQQITKGSTESITIPINKTPTRMGYTLSGWKIGKDSTKTYLVSDGSITILTADITTNAITLYAVWESKTYTITFKDGKNYATTITDKFPAEQYPNKADSNSNDYKIEYTISSSITLPTLTSTDETYSFMGWRVETSGATEVWQLADVLKANVSASGLYGDVVIKPLWGVEEIIKYEHTTIEKTYGDEDFINPITRIPNNTISFSYSSSNTSVAEVNSTTGKVTIKKVGETTITATPTGKTPISYTLTVVAKNINRTIVTNYELSYKETGSQIAPAIIIQDMTSSTSGTLIENTDYTVAYGENKNPATNGGTITITGKGNYTGTRIINFTILEVKKITDATINAGSRVYNGKAELPEITISYNGTNLTPGVHYTATTTDVNATTTARVTIEGIGDYSGSTTVNYIITPKPITISGVTATDRFANGTTTVNLTGGTLSGVVSGDTVDFTLGQGTIATATSGQNKAVTANITLTGDDSSNYTLTQPTGIKVNINRPQITFNANNIGSFTGSTTIYVEYDVGLRVGATGDTTATIPTFTYNGTSKAKVFGGYFNSVSGSTQVVDVKYNIKDTNLSSYKITANETYYAREVSIYDTASPYYTGYVTGSFNDTSTKVKYKMVASAYTYFTPNSTSVAKNSYVAFGWFPQTVAVSEVVSDSSSSVIFNKWNCQIGTDGYYYVSCTANPYDTSNYKYSSGTTITNIATYFRLEPIVWKVLEVDNNAKKADNTTYSKALLYSVNELTANVQYHASSNNYENSNIRAYLNGLSGTHSNKGFLQQAFTTSQNDIIDETEVDNSASTTNTDSNGENKYTCANTNDKIFLLSYQDMLNSADYNFSSSTSSTDTRIKFPTDYAGANYAYRSSTANYGGYYWLRSPDSGYSGFAWSVNTGGGLDYNYVDTSSTGVVPALFLQI